MEAKLIRQKFLEFFAKHGHQVVKSSPLIPFGDNTLLFTNAGMNQFKDVFLGLEKRDYVRAVSAQKCVRAGGKHNDLENVGFTARHHTFFEMLGNFSFGDYFKRDAIKFAWEFLTVELKLPADKLYVTVYHTDDEAYQIWNQEINLDASRIIKIGDKADGGSDNFWQMGDTGPCGPCTEIFYDHGDSIFGGLPGSKDEDGDRYVEIWNCVFMQYNRDEKGVLHNLPKPSVDTGMGLERISAVIQGVHSNYEIDLFVKLINKAAQILQAKELQAPSLKVIADHIRSISFLIADGVLPSNEGRGYVLRRIIRRAIRHGYKLGTRSPFLHKIVPALVIEMGDAYPELKEQEKNIVQTVHQEEEKFFQTVEHGMELLLQEITQLTANPNNAVEMKLAGAVAFKLYDTYGFPLDLTEDVCREQNIKVDVAMFDKNMEQQKQMAKQAGKFKTTHVIDYAGVDTQFVGYTSLSVDSQVVALYKNEEKVEKLNPGDDGIVVLAMTPFYAESGGQVGDSGVLEIEGGVGCLFEVADTQKIRSQVFGHVGKLVSGQLKVGDTITATVDAHTRHNAMRNHSATHLLHKALREVLGDHVVQKGSLVCDQYTRFDFSHNKPLAKAEVNEIERIVNHVIMMNYEVTIKEMVYQDAVDAGAMALFGEKYSDAVRVVAMGEFSCELCGGTHVARTGDIGLFTIISESGVAGGIRRIEAVTGEVAVKQMQSNMLILDQLNTTLKAQGYATIIHKVDDLINNNKEKNRNITELQNKLAKFEADELLQYVETLADEIKLLITKVDAESNDTLAALIDQLKNKIGEGVIILIATYNDKLNFAVGVTKLLTKNYHAGQIISKLTELLGGKGGGRPDFAIGGGNLPGNVDQVINQIKQIIVTK